MQRETDVSPGAVRPARPSGAVHRHGLHGVLHPVWFGPVHRTLVRELAARLGERVLDVGAGAGELAARLATSGATVVCVEPDDESLASARKRLAGRNAEFVSAYAESLPLPDASADGAVVSLSVHHWEDRQKGFAELARVIRPGGRLVIAEFRPAGPIRRWVHRLGIGKHGPAPGVDVWTAELTRAGFSGVREVRAGWASVLALFLRAER